MAPRLMKTQIGLWSQVTNPDRRRAYHDDFGLLIDAILGLVATKRKNNPDENRFDISAVDVLDHVCVVEPSCINGPAWYFQTLPLAEA
jgi:hypothetical protein